ncbi:tumor necrosis factor receptor superfamily member 14-like [Sinocyclocheilus anshuiensis]|uniref:tumor necrosis factor receptor superfamily member 14-like n=1 Tax=Sinocyclocheilus anshuiensis TaxID=1608454 RepID=UPI0007BA7025|nr:PREDICTED: tumor necrosis factor receptor superfamily member 14-like [Sinocyclocheilus anshuiensis]
MVERLNMKASLLCIFGICSFLTYGNTCGPSEYKSADGECCPMCNVGSVVYRHCTGDFSTTCIPCTPGTFTSQPNGLDKCFPCKHCAESQGLYSQSKCTTIQNTICDVLDGYYCIDYSDSQCRHAEKHSVCKPGQETKTPGTKTSDTECVHCAPGFYSPSGLNCTKWTDCAARNGIKAEDGSPVKDVRCVQKRKRYCLVALCPPVICAAVIAALYRRAHSEAQTVNNGDKRYKSPIEETPKTSGQPPEENHEDPTNDT